MVVMEKFIEAVPKSKCPKDCSETRRKRKSTGKVASESKFRTTRIEEHLPRNSQSPMLTRAEAKKLSIKPSGHVLRKPQSQCHPVILTEGQPSVDEYFWNENVTDFLPEVLENGRTEKSGDHGPLPIDNSNCLTIECTNIATAAKPETKLCSSSALPVESIPPFPDCNAEDVTKNPFWSPKVEVSQHEKTDKIEKELVDLEFQMSEVIEMKPENLDNMNEEKGGIENNKLIKKELADPDYELYEIEIRKIKGEVIEDVEVFKNEIIDPDYRNGIDIIEDGDVDLKKELDLCNDDEVEIKNKEIDDIEAFKKEWIDLDYNNEIDNIENVEEFKEEMVNINIQDAIDEIKNEKVGDDKELNKEMTNQEFGQDDEVPKMDNLFVECEDSKITRVEMGTINESSIENEIEAAAEEVMENNEPVSIEIKQIPILQQQMAQHVQMLTQNFILTYKHPELHQLSTQLNEYLLNMKYLCDGKERSMFQTVNLLASLELVDYWKSLLASDSGEVQAMHWHVEETIAKSIRGHQHGSTYIVTFPSLILKTISNSSVFVYPSLLPKIPFKTLKISVKACVYYSQSEDHLISLGMEQFMPLVTGKEKCFQKNWSTKKGVAVCQFIQKHILTYRGSAKIFNHINFVRHSRPKSNPINYYFQFGTAPAYVHHVIPLEPLLPPFKRSPEELPYQWKEFVKSQQENQEVDFVGPFIVLVVH